MSLNDEIAVARKEIVSDGYDMSIGEVMNLYRDGEIIINPVFQRLFRWDESRKTRFIESLLLGIPIPPIFVFQREDGVWELIDGLQRLSTIFEFAGMLYLPDKTKAPPSVLNGTKFLPSLADKRWESSSQDATDGIDKTLQLAIKRARIRVEILKQESDPYAKYELFQRLNTGGAELSKQEVRNCVAVMLNEEFYKWLTTCSESADFRLTVDQTEYAIAKQSTVELALRFFAFRNVPYQFGFDVHEYLDEAMLQIANSINKDEEGDVFHRTFALIKHALADKAFKRWNGNDFAGMFLMSMFEVVTMGISKNLQAIEAMGLAADEFVTEKCKALWSNELFQKNSGAGVRGTTRLSTLLPMAEKFFRP
ncbi:MAG: DUF262 domain-containing protein [Pelobacteraceae bacterium]